jgi:uncharacterized membrane protein (DUF4010 family)
LFNKKLLVGLILPLSVIFLVAAAATAYFFLKDRMDKSREENLPLGKPLEMTTAVIFGVLYIGILLMITYANDYFGDEGIYITSGIAGMSDVDAISISISKMSTVSISPLTAQNAILIATLANTVSKFVIAFWASSKDMRKKVLIGYGAIFMASLLAFGILNLFG